MAFGRRFSQTQGPVLNVAFGEPQCENPLILAWTSESQTGCQVFTRYVKECPSACDVLNAEDLTSLQRVLEKNEKKKNPIRMLAEKVPESKIFGG